MFVHASVVNNSIKSMQMLCKYKAFVYLHMDKPFTLTLILLSYILHLLKAYVKIYQIHLHGLCVNVLEHVGV